MRARLEFDLPEDELEHIRAVNGDTYHSCLWSIANKLREMRKYRELSDAEHKVVTEIEEFFHGLLEDKNVNLDDG